eukprot:TRINITY_DN16782_c0_g1_i3.p1 TRINITY_DN16782_c0_g1~~TRINITY_DN16782_c0_g1_i3.p1  ORF type:complete len:136 (-),score=32.09 TRINITY_DN16782_c0_g1_i3:10-417(-)
MSSDTGSKQQRESAPILSREIEIQEEHVKKPETKEERQRDKAMRDMKKAIRNIKAKMRVKSDDEREEDHEEQTKESREDTLLLLGVGCATIWTLLSAGIALGTSIAIICIGILFQEIGRAVQQECRDRSRMPSSA